MSALKHLKNTAEDPVLGFLAIHGRTGDTPLSFSKLLFFRSTLWQGWDFPQVSGSKLGVLEQLPLRCSRWNTPNYCSNTHAKFWSWLTILRAQNPTVGFHSPSALDKPWHMVCNSKGIQLRCTSNLRQGWASLPFPALQLGMHMQQSTFSGLQKLINLQASVWILQFLCFLW